MRCPLHGPLLYTLEGDEGSALALTSLTPSSGSGAVLLPGMDPDMPSLSVGVVRSSAIPDASWPHGAQPQSTEEHPIAVEVVPFAFTGHADARAMRTWLALGVDCT